MSSSTVKLVGRTTDFKVRSRMITGLCDVKIIKNHSVESEKLNEIKICPVVSITPKLANGSHFWLIWVTPSLLMSILAKIQIDKSTGSVFPDNFFVSLTILSSNRITFFPFFPSRAKHYGR